MCELISLQSHTDSYVTDSRYCRFASLSPGRIDIRIESHTWQANDGHHIERILIPKIEAKRLWDLQWLVFAL